MSDPQRGPAPGTQAGPPASANVSGAYGAYVTFVFALVFMLAAADRNIMSILLAPIQAELGASDTAMGALNGAAFSIVYATAALPLARIADRGNRRRLVGFAVAAWSLMTALCGAATGFVGLLLARMGVAMGEAAHQPGALSLVADVFPRSRRGIVVACVTIGSAVGIALGAFLAGRLNDLYGWRAAFLAMAAPGLVVAALVLFTMPEPRRGRTSPTEREAPDAGLWTGLKYLLRIPTISRLLVAKVLLQLGFQGFLAWAPTFLIRVHGLSTSEMSAGFGAAVGGGSIISMVVAGLVSDQLSKRGERWRAYYCALALAAGLVPVLAMLFAPTAPLAIAALFLMSLTTGGVVSASLTAGLSVVRPTSRGLMTAMMTFATSGLGAGLGPVLFGAIADGLSSSFGASAIRYALLGVPAAFVCASIFFVAAGRTTDHDVEIAERG